MSRWPTQLRPGVTRAFGIGSDAKSIDLPICTANLERLRMTSGVASVGNTGSICCISADRSKCIRSDIGPEFISKAIRSWLERLGIKIFYIAPGSPWDATEAAARMKAEGGSTNTVESFHSKFRDEFLNRDLFENLRAAQQLTSN